MANIGFIGLGHMGLPMALHLIRAGHLVTGYDLQTEALSAFVEAGGHRASSLIALAVDHPVIITMLQTGQQVLDVCCGPSGIYAHAAAGSLHIDCSTIDVSSARKLHEQADTHGLRSVDAPVSGGVSGATAASLTFMVGGLTPACVAAEVFLKTMGKQIILTGAPGSGQAAKICNNMILGISMLAVSEGFLLAQSLGLSPQKLHEVVTHASGQCWVMDHYVPVPNVLENVPANHDYEAGFTLAMMLKDLSLSQQAAAQVGLTTPVAHLAQTIFQDGKDAGLGALDFSAIIGQLKNASFT